MRNTISGIRDKRSVMIAVVVALIAPVLFWAAAKSLATNSNEILDWLPQNFEETQRLIWFAERFGSDEIIAVGWDGCLLTDERVDEFVELANASLDPQTGKPIFGEVTSGRQVLRELTQPPLELPESLAKKRMRYWLIGESDATCVVARINIEAAYHGGGEFRLEALGEVDRIGAVQRLRDIGVEMGLKPSELRVAGPTVDSVAIDLAGRQWTIAMGAASVFSGFALAWLCLRSWWQVIVVFATSLIAAAASLAIVWLSGNKMDAVLMTMPAIIFVLATSGGIHFTHYLNGALRASDASNRAEAPWRAIRMGLVPCSLACVTTTIGLASLSISRVRPVYRFGVFSAIGVAISLVLLLLFWPALSQILLRRRLRKAAADGETGAETNAGTDTDPTDNHHSEWWMPLCRFSIRFYPLILSVSAIGLVVLGYGLTQINASVHLKNLLRGNADLLISYDWLQEEIGPIIPVEIVLQFPTASDANEGGEAGDGDDTGDGKSSVDKRDTAKKVLARALIIEDLRREVESLDRSGGTVAATTFAPDFPAGSGGRNLVSRMLIANRMSSRLEDYRELRFIASDESTELWRITTRVSASELDYASFLSEVEAVVNTKLQSVNEGLDPSQHIHSKICGAVPLIQMAQKQLLKDFIWSLALAFILIGLTIVILLRSPVAGVVSMVPNIFPTVVVFGWMGLKGTPIDIGTMMTASVALGVAVDDTLHFLVWVRREMLKGGTREEAIQVAFKQSATAMLQTSVICGVGMAPFMVSPFGPIAGFAGMMFALLMMALVGDLVLLPALIASPLGNSFLPKTK